MTRNVEPLTRKGIQLTRKVMVNFYGFIFLLKRIISGNFGTKNVLPAMRKHYRTAALLHDVLRKPHRQSVYLKLKQKKRTSRFLSTLRFLFGRSDRIRTCGIVVPNAFMMALSAENGFFRPFPLGKPRSLALLYPLFPSAPKR